ncbi:MAG: diaminopimelate epimerase [Planctomycetota bacterium]|nr:diaminopimelate epimerase [Planctomycetota bacterium]
MNRPIPFTKMQGAGNDYVYLDAFRHPLPDNLPELARQVSDRHFGVGGDGLIVIHPSTVADARMQMLNADGSEAEMCGNGIRCVAKYVYDHKLCQNNPLRIETQAGILTLRVEVHNELVQEVEVDMGAPRLAAAAIPTTLSGDSLVNIQLADLPQLPPVTCISMGNPHCIVYVPELTDDWVLRVGPQIENHPIFPRRTNVEFVQVLSRTEVRQRTWERGSGETLACGTGASAVCVAGVLGNHTDRSIRVHLLGGALSLHWDADSNHVLMRGPAVEVFHGEWG